MNGKSAFLFIVISLFTSEISAQCIDRDSLWKHLQVLKNSSAVLASDEIPLLLKYEAEMKSCSYNNDSTYALLLRSIGDMFYQLGNYLAAIEYYRQSINIINTNQRKPSINYVEQVRNYYLLSVVYEALDNVSERMIALDSCANIALRLKHVDLACLWAIYSRVEFYFDIGDYERCIEYAIICERLGKEYANKGAERIYSGGLIYASSSLHWHVNALLVLKKYREAEKLLHDRVDENSSTGQTTNLGTLYEQLAEVQAENGDLKKAIISFNHAFKHEFAKGNVVGCKTILNNLGYFIFQNKGVNPDSAIFYYRKALRLKNNNELLAKAESIESLNIFNNVAGAFVQKKQFDSARKYFQFAFDQIKSGTNETEIVNGSFQQFRGHRKIRYITSLIIDKGFGYHEQYKTSGQSAAINEAIRIYRLADRFLDSVKTEQFDTESKLFWRSDSRRLYERAIEACYVTGNIADAFYFFEKSRAVLLNDQLYEQRWSAENVILKQIQLKKKILQLIRESDTLAPTAERYKVLQNELYFNRKEMDSLTGIIRINAPLYYQNYLDQGQITLKEVRDHILKNHQVVIEIFAGDSAVFALILTAQTNKLIRINKPVFDSLAHAYLDLIADRVKLNKDFDHFIRVSHDLYRVIFQNTLIPEGRVIISPDGQYFPFEALVASNPGVLPSYFLNDHIVSYTYSIRYLLTWDKTDIQKTSKTFMGVAPVSFSSNFGLSKLPGSDGSLMRLKSYFPGAQNFVGPEASKANFLSQFGNYRIIQLYTHAADSGYNGEPVIWFADSVLLLSELMFEGRNAGRLIVLSACETGKGKFYSGEGVFSFNRGFAALGIPSSITNIWSVDNEATYRITEVFYKYLAKGIPPDIALQKAKIEFIESGSKEQRLPYYWAASIFVGINDAIEFEKKKSWPWILAGISIALILIAAGINNYRRQKKAAINLHYF